MHALRTLDARVVPVALRLVALRQQPSLGRDDFSGNLKYAG